MGNIGKLLNDLMIQARLDRSSKERPQERYARVLIKLDDTAYVGTDIELHVSGDYLGKIKYNGSSTGCYLKLNNKHSGKIYASEFRRTYAEYDRIYLTNPSSQAGKELVIVVGGAFAGEIEPSTGAKTGLIDSGGADVDPATTDIELPEDSVHASGDKGVMALGVRKSSPVTLSSANGDYEPFQMDDGEVYVQDLILRTLPQAEDSVHTPGHFGIMGLGVRKATPANLSGADGDYEPLQINDGLLWVEQKDVFNSAVDTIMLHVSGTPYSKSVSAPNTAAAFEASEKKMRVILIRNTHATYEAKIGDANNQYFTLKGGESISLDNVDLTLLYHKADSNGENPTLELIGTSQ